MTSQVFGGWKNTVLSLYLFSPTHPPQSPFTKKNVFFLLFLPPFLLQKSIFFCQKNPSFHHFLKLKKKKLSVFWVLVALIIVIFSSYRRFCLSNLIFGCDVQSFYYIKLVMILMYSIV